VPPGTRTLLKRRFSRRFAFLVESCGRRGEDTMHYTTAGESHGRALVSVVSDVPAHPA